MKYFITPNTLTKHGFELIKVDENGIETVVALDKKTADDYLYLPDDVVKATNRRLIGINGIKKANVERYELTVKEYHEPRVLGPRDNSQPRKKLEDYLTDEEKAIIEDLMNKAKARKEADKPKPLTEVEKAKIAAQKAQAKYEALLAKSNEEWHLRKEGDK